MSGSSSSPSAALIRFEGAYLADPSILPDDAKLECKVCWHVYDPDIGCETWQVPPGTPFRALPADWRCPVCDGDRGQFMLIGDATALTLPAVAAPATSSLPDKAIADLEAAFREIHRARMAGNPLVNGALAVKAAGFRPWDGRWLGALITPWFINLILLPGDGDDWSGLVGGAKELVEFPSGRYEFVHANRPETGPYKACSLFSPVFEFTTMLQATDTVLAALVAIFDPSIREEGTRAGEIRQQREAELNPPQPAPAATSPLTPTDGGEEAAPAAPPSRRALFGLKDGAASDERS